MVDDESISIRSAYWAKSGLRRAVHGLKGTVEAMQVSRSMSMQDCISGDMPTHQAFSMRRSSR